MYYWLTGSDLHDLVAHDTHEAADEWLRRHVLQLAAEGRFGGQTFDLVQTVRTVAPVLQVTLPTVDGDRVARHTEPSTLSVVVYPGECCPHCDKPIDPAALADAVQGVEGTWHAACWAELSPAVQAELRRMQIDEDADLSSLTCDVCGKPATYGYNNKSFCGGGCELQALDTRPRHDTPADEAAALADPAPVDVAPVQDKPKRTRKPKAGPVDVAPVQDEPSPAALTDALDAVADEGKPTCSSCGAVAIPGGLAPDSSATLCRPCQDAAQAALQVAAQAAAQVDDAPTAGQLARERRARVRDCMRKLDELIGAAPHPLSTDDLRAQLLQIPHFAALPDIVSCVDEALDAGHAAGRWGIDIVGRLFDIGAAPAAAGAFPAEARQDVADPVDPPAPQPDVAAQGVVQLTNGAIVPAADMSPRVEVDDQIVRVFDGKSWHWKRTAGPRSATSLAARVQDAIDGKGIYRVTEFTASMQTGRGLE